MRSTKVSLTNQEVQERLVAAGVQPTLQRISICQFVLCNSDHPTAEDVHSWAEKNLSKISLATVYNTLNTLVEAGLLREFRFPHTDRVIYDNNLEDHYHFFDETTHKLYDIEPGDVAINLNLEKKFEVNTMEVLLKGQFRK
jgi:Fur family iron response transcriptional regulator